MVDTHKNDKEQVINIVYEVDHKGEIVHRYTQSQIDKEKHTLVSDNRYLYFIGGFQNIIDEDDGNTMQEFICKDITMVK